MGKANIILLGGALIAGASQTMYADTILPPGAVWEYTFTDPTGDASWDTSSGGWTTGAAPFGNTVGGDFGHNTLWPAHGNQNDDLWVRTTINLSGYDLSSVNWFLGVDNGFKLYLNGVLVSQANAEGFTSRWEYSGDFADGVLVSGLNYVAVALEDHGGLTAFDTQITGDRRTTGVPEGGATVVLFGLGIACLASIRRGFER